MVNVADFAPYSDETVAAFYRAIEDACKASRKTYICVADVEVVATVTRVDDVQDWRTVSIRKVHSVVSLKVNP